LIAALSIGMVALAACGSDNSGSGSSANTTAGGSATTAAGGAGTTAAAPTKSVIKIGMVAPLSGAGVSNNPGMADIASAWEKTTNASGGINGHPVKVIVADDGSDGAKGLAAVKDLVENQGVAAIAGTHGSFSEYSWADYVKEKNIPVVGGDSYTPPWEENPMFFPTYQTQTYSSNVPWTNAKAVGAKKVSTIVCAEVEVCSQLDNLSGPYARANGLAMMPLQKAAFADPNYLAQCTNAKNAGVDYIWLALPRDVAIRVINDCLSQGYSPTFHIQNLTNGSPLGDIKGAHMYGGVEAIPWFYQGPENKAFRDAMDKYNGGTANKDWQGDFSTMSWGGLEMVKKAVENAPATDTVTSQTVLDGLYNTKNEDLGKLLPQPVTFSKTAPTSVNKCEYVLEVKDGNFSLPQGLKPVCTELVK
jgi:branched-chain amino acid transport system substrate-binding protein